MWKFIKDYWFLMAALLGVAGWAAKIDAETDYQDVAIREVKEQVQKMDKKIDFLINKLIREKD